jgi:probable F420-dependent oxidoreductase
MSAWPSVGIFPSSTDRSMPLVDLARAAEARGFASIFLNEHTHLPVDHSRSQWPGGHGTTPDTYARFWDPLVALTMVAAHTRLTLGTAISLVAEHDPIAMAKAVATLDVLSEGRVVLGVGWGWNREEFENHGRGPANTRASVALEHLAVMQALWHDDVASHSGPRVRFDAVQSYPKPVQRPGPPVLLGAPYSERNVNRIVEQADGWIPMGPRVLFDDGFPVALAELRARWSESRRQPSGPAITVIQAARDADRLSRALHRAADLAVERVIVYVGEWDASESLRFLDVVAPALSP